MFRIVTDLVALPKVDFISGFFLGALEGAAELGLVHPILEAVVRVDRLPQLGRDAVFEVLI